MGVIKSQLSPFNWKTILVLVLAVGALFFVFRLFGKFNTAPEAVTTAVAEQMPPQQLPQQMEAPPQYEQPQEQQSEEDAQVEQAVANE